MHNYWLNKLAILFSTVFLWGGLALAKDVKVAVISFSPPGDAPVDVPKSNVDKYKEQTADALEAHIREAASEGAKLVVTPEFSTVGYPDIPELPNEEDEFQNREQIEPYVETLSGKTVKRFSSVAKELGIWLVIGIAEKDSSDEYFNTLVAISPKGRVAQSYRKINLFEGETKFLSAGKRRTYFDTEFGRVGLFTCFDIHFDHPAGDLVAKDGAEIIAFGTSWVGKNGMATFKRFAKDYNVYFLAANHIYFPDSGVISPGGIVQSHTQENEPAYGVIKTEH